MGAGARGKGGAVGGWLFVRVFFLFVWVLAAEVSRERQGEGGEVSWCWVVVGWVCARADVRADGRVVSEPRVQEFSHAPLEVAETRRLRGDSTRRRGDSTRRRRRIVGNPSFFSI